MKRFLLKIKENYEIIIITLVFAVIFSLIIGFFTVVPNINSAKIRKFNHYGEENYSYVTVTVGSGRSVERYEGVIHDDEYDKWVNGEDGTLWLECFQKRFKGRGYRLNIDTITQIVKYDSDKYIPFGF